MVTRPAALTSSGPRNAPLLSLVCGAFTLQGWSRAGVQTYWRIPEWRLAIDQGAHPWELASASVLALTHFHADHAAGLISFLSTRNLQSLPPPTVAFPAPYEAALRAFLRAWSELSGDTLRCTLAPLAAGDELPLGPRRVLRAFTSVHVVPTLGYAVIEKRARLKPELQGLTGKEIAARRHAGDAVEDVVEEAALAFCGDTTVATLDANPFLYDVGTLLLETTFLGGGPTPEDARRFGHVHLDEVVERAALFRNERLVLTHFSLRHEVAEVIERLDAALPEALAGRVVAWI